ncbi:MAG: ribosomal protein S18-alanine N-acetyltransferase [Candidatus Hydrothermia bacterium]|jgi:ribosomal-protein-alanine N-acetyltransferase|nr:ribosomal protein S18-alanine N-acetyltransferase [Candidatus Hydrothermia bacterium]
MQFIIREAKRSDLIRIAEIEKLSFEFESWGLFFLGKFLEIPYNKIIVAENNEILGYCAFSDEGEIIHIKSIAVHPNYRNKGIAKALIKEVMKLKKDIYLEVRVSNEIAIKLYENLGFKKIKTIKKFYSNGEDAYRYYLKNAN